MASKVWLGKEAGFSMQGTAPPGPPMDFDPLHRGGRTAARWTLPYAGYNQPLLELPQNKFLRIALAVNAWMGEPIINNAAKLTLALALERMNITVTSISKDWPKWFPKEEKDRWGDKPSIGVAAYVKQKLLELCEYLDMQTFWKEEGLDLFTSGDGFVNIATNALPAEEKFIWDAPSKPEMAKRVEMLKKKMLSDGRGDYQICALQSLNPSACWLYPDYTGRIVNAKVVHLLGEGVWDVNLDNLIHIKCFATFPWVIYGISHFISSLRWVDIKFKVMDAVYVSANRFINPREYLKIVGPIDPNTKAELPPLETQMVWAEQILSSYNANVPFALPSGWEWEFVGAEGKVLKVENLIEKIDDQIRTSAMVSRTFTSGSANVPAYATSKLQAGVMYKVIEPTQEKIARAIEGRILSRFLLFNGFFEDDGQTLVSAKVEFDTLPIQGDDSLENKIQILYDRGLLSKHTAWEFEGMDPVLEFDRMLREAKGDIEPFRATAPDLSPDQTTDRFNAAMTAYKLSQATKARGHEKLLGAMNRFIHADFNDNKESIEKEFYNVNRYLVECAGVMHGDFNHAKNRLDHAVDYEDQVMKTVERMKEIKSDEDKLKDDPANVTTYITKGEVNGKASEIAASNSPH